MQHYLKSSPALRHDRDGLFYLLSDAKFHRRRPPSQFMLKSGSLSSLDLRRIHGSLPLRLLQSRPNLQCNSRRIVCAAPVNACIGDDSPRKSESIQKMTKIALSVAVVAGFVMLARTGSALASSQIVLPSIARSPVATSSGREVLVSAWMGLMAGCLHTLTGPDHLAALAPLSIGRTRLESVAVGALWGCGHDAGQVIFGILFLLLKDKLQIEVLRTWGARVVGMTLVAIGITGIKEAQEAAMVPCLAGDSRGLAPNGLPHMEPVNTVKRNTVFATFATGIVHGLQPDALIMILPALALPSRFAGAAFLSMFLLGTVLSMSGYTAFIGSCSTALKKRIPRITEHLAWGSSLVAIFVGIGILAGELFGLSIF